MINFKTFARKMSSIFNCTCKHFEFMFKSVLVKAGSKSSKRNDHHLT